ncbi:MAG: fatty acid desaturase, partial [Bacteroidales bacterium]
MENYIDFELNKIRKIFNSVTVKNKTERYMSMKIILFYLFWIIVYITYLLLLPYKSGFLLPVLVGICNVLLAINLGHDLIHKSYLRNKFLSFLSKHSFTIIGMDIFFWKKNHNIHHNKTNQVGHDNDIETSIIPFLRFYKNNKHVAKYQYIYFPFLYAFGSLWGCYLKDTTDLIRYKGAKKNLQFVFLTRKSIHVFL